MMNVDASHKNLERAEERVGIALKNLRLGILNTSLVGIVWLLAMAFRPANTLAPSVIFCVGVFYVVIGLVNWWLAILERNGVRSGLNQENFVSDNADQRG